MALKASTALVFICAGLHASLAAGFGFADLVSTDPGCVEYKVTGICYKKGIPVGYKVRHFLPVVVTEAIRDKDDSVFQTGGTMSQEATRVTDGHEQAFEARVWEYVDAVKVLKEKLGNCALCGDPGGSGGADLAGMLGRR